MKISVVYLTNKHEANEAESAGGSSVYDRVKNTQIVSLKCYFHLKFFFCKGLTYSNQLVLHQVCEQLIIRSVLQMGNRYPQPKRSARSRRMLNPHPHEAGSSLHIYSIVMLNSMGSHEQSSVNCRVLYMRVTIAITGNPGHLLCHWSIQLILSLITMTSQDSYHMVQNNPLPCYRNQISLKTKSSLYRLESTLDFCFLFELCPKMMVKTICEGKVRTSNTFCKRKEGQPMQLLVYASLTYP